MKNIPNVIMFIVITIVMATALFWLVSQKFMYLLTQQLSNALTLQTSVNGIPNQGGIVMHGVVLGLLLALILTIAGHFLLME